MEVYYYYHHLLLVDEVFVALQTSSCKRSLSDVIQTQLS